MQILHLNYSPDIIRDMKLRQMTRAGHVERMGEIKFHIKFWFENLKGRIRLEELEVNRRIIFQCILKTGGLTNWTGFNWLRGQESVAGSCERDDEQRCK